MSIDATGAQEAPSGAGGGAVASVESGGQEAPGGAVGGAVPSDESSGVSSTLRSPRQSPAEMHGDLEQQAHHVF